MISLGDKEISLVNGGTCLKTQLSTASAVAGTTGTILSTWATTMHLNLNMTDPVLSKSQRTIAIAVNVAGLCCNLASNALSIISASQTNCTAE